MIGIQFEKYTEKARKQSKFEALLDLFQELLVYTSGDVEEAIKWMRQINQEHQITDDNYSIDDFLNDLEKQQYIKPKTGSDQFNMGAKMDRLIRTTALEQVFGKLKKGDAGDHRTALNGSGGDTLPELRNYQYGDSIDKVAMTESLRSARIMENGHLNIEQDDLKVREHSYKTQTSTVLMIDISHSMILYGEDRITPSKKVAMALAEFISRKYPKDTLDIIVFGNDAWEVSKKDLPYLNVGPYHTNTVAGLQLAQTLLRRKKNPNKQIFMITDGKPSCLKEPGGYYKNSFGLDPKIVNRTLNEAAACRRAKISITTFMIASDTYLKTFIEQFTEANNGKAFYSGLDDLGAFIFRDFQTNRQKRI